MQYSEIKNNIISLGFAEPSDYEEFESLGYTYSAINRAISTIGQQFPYIGKYEFEIDDTDEGPLYVDMSDREGFLDFAMDTPVLVEKDGEETFKKFNDYEIEMGTTLVINASEDKGRFRVYYDKECTQIDAETPDGYVPEIPTKTHRLIPLLASYYLWLDDDERKAVQYYNQYETELMVVQSKATRPRMRILEGGL